MTKETKMKMILKAAVVLAAALSIAGCSKKAGSQKAEAVSTAPAIEIAFGDYDAMVSLSSKLQNGGCEEGQTVIIDGELSVFMSASIGQRNGDEYIGTTLELEDTELDAYPETPMAVVYLEALDQLRQEP